MRPPSDVKHKSSYQNSAEGYFKFVPHLTKTAEQILENYTFNTSDIYNIYKSVCSADEMYPSARLWDDLLQEAVETQT